MNVISSLYILIHNLLTIGIKPLVGQSNSSVTVLDNPGPSVDKTRYKARYISELVSLHFLFFFINLMHAST